MPRPVVAVTFPADPPAREAVEGVLADLAEVRWLHDSDHDARRETLAEATVILSWSPARELSAEDLAAATNVRLLQVMSAGADTLPFDRLPTELTVASNVGAYAEPMAEHVVAMILTLAKRLPARRFELQRGEWHQLEPPSLRIEGSACAILGFGGIGKAVARRMEALGARILIVNRTGRTEDPVAFVGTLGDLDHVLEEADSIVVALPLTLATRGLIADGQLARMRPAAILVNVARGPIVEEDALYRHLVATPGFGAGIDAWWDEPARGEAFHPRHRFLDLPNVVGSPHSSAIVAGFDGVAAAHAARNVARCLRGEPLAGLVRREDYVA